MLTHTSVQEAPAPRTEDQLMEPVAIVGIAPMLIVHGEADDIVPPEQAHDLAERAHRIGLPAQLVAVPGLGHDIGHTHPAWTELWSTIAAFLQEGPR